MKKRLVVFLLAALMTVTAVTGCGKSQTTAENFAPSDSSYTQTAADVCEEATADYTYYESESVAGNYESAGAVTAESAVNSFAVKGDVAAYDDMEMYFYDPASGETYEKLAENGFTSVKENPLSTFAADVDTASYANMRRLVEQGCGLYDFPQDSIRTEEFVNYFKYNYDGPAKGEVFGVDATISECPWDRDSKLMVLGISTDELKEREKPASNIVFLLDVSGSMSNANKLPLLKDAMELLVDELDEDDRVSIVTYASGTNVVLEGAKGSEHRKINRAFNSLKAGGSTNGAGGIELAYEVAEDYFIEGGNNRVIIGTDGDFNVGISSQQGLCDLISEKKESGVFLSVFGFGMGNYNDVTAETLADAGNGNYSYIDSLSEAKKVLVDEMSSTLYTVAKDTKLQVEFNPALVSEYRLIGYENRMLDAQDFKDDSKDGGELGAGHQVTAVYEIKLAGFDTDETELKYQDSTLSKKGASRDEWCTLSIAYKDPDADESQYKEFPIGVNNYTKNPSDDFKFVTAVCEYAMALKDSDNLKSMDREEALEQAYKTVSKIRNLDEYQKEFASLMKTVLNSDSYGSNYWYD